MEREHTRTGNRIEALKRAFLDNVRTTMADCMEIPNYSGDCSRIWNGLIPYIWISGS